MAILQTAPADCWIQFGHSSHWSLGSGSCSLPLPGPANSCQPAFKSMYEGGLDRSNTEYIGIRVYDDDYYCVSTGASASETGSGQGASGGCYSTLATYPIRIDFDISNFGQTGAADLNDFKLLAGVKVQQEVTIDPVTGEFSVYLPVGIQCRNTNPEHTDIGTSLFFQSIGNADSPLVDVELLEVTIVGAVQEQGGGVEVPLSIGWNDTFELFIESNGI